MLWFLNPINNTYSVKILCHLSKQQLSNLLSEHKAFIVAVKSAECAWIESFCQCSDIWSIFIRTPSHTLYFSIIFYFVAFATCFFFLMIFTAFKDPYMKQMPYLTHATFNKKWGHLSEKYHKLKYCVFIALQTLL